MPEHHPIFATFQPQVDFIRDSYLGTVSRREFTSEAIQEIVTASDSGGLPAFNEEYFEWIDLLESIKAWKAGNGPYTFMELGAGYGRWSVRAAFARPLARIIAVEAEPTHYLWLLQNVLDNGVVSDRHKFVEAAVSDKPGECLFHVGRSAEWYGQCIAEPDGEGLTTPCVTLPQLLEPVSIVDLIDMDIQGSEYIVLRAGMEEVNQKVKRLHIATHSREIEQELRLLGSLNGWESVWDFEGCKTHETPYGVIEFQDGVQSWINKRLV